MAEASDSSQPAMPMNTTTPQRPPLSSFDDHPLEVFAWARRIPPSPLRDIAYTVVFNLLIAGVFTLFAMLFTKSAYWGDAAWANVVFANCIGFLIHIGFGIGDWITGRRCRTWPFVARAVYFTSIPILGVLGGYWVGALILSANRVHAAVFSASGIVSVVAISVLISGILGIILSARERAARSEAAFEAERARVATAERAAALAQLKALEAQVEPHFLYNTLAHVTTLIDREPATAKRMLDRLIVLLRASAAGGANGGSSLGEQAAHMRAYLEIVAMRLGPRLTWTIDVPASLAGRAIPPAILQPLVENAVKHGIEPAMAGGAIAITASESGGRMLLEVADTGAGFGTTTSAPGRSTGLGLANLRARLAALYGTNAQVAITENRPSGVRVSVSLPSGEAHG